MITGDLTAVETWLTRHLAQVSPAARRALLRSITTELRRRNRDRMTRQVGPDGTPWAPRRVREAANAVRRKAKMMVGLRSARRLRIKVDGEGAELGWMGGGRDSRIATVHHEGLPDRVAPHGPQVVYPARPLIGLPPEDIAWVRDQLLAHLTGD